MNFYKQTRGAVSVFLVIILVPCILISSLFVDIGRVYLSKTMAQSSSDLALNSLLTNYDGDLNEYYGMIASCQNIEDFYEESAKFFLRTVSSQGLSKEELHTVCSFYSDVTDDKTIYDLLQVECQTDTAQMISAVPNANLANETMLKKQIVEFMKYRAPIEIGKQIVEIFEQKDESGVTLGEKIVDSDKNQKLVDDKRDYYEAEGEFLKAAFRSHKAIMEYYDAATAMQLNNNGLQGYIDKVNGYKNSYQEIHEKVVSNLFNTEGLTQYTRVTYDVGSYQAKYDAKGIGAKKVEKEIEDENGKKEKITFYYLKADKANGYVNDLKEKIEAFKQARSDFETAASSVTSQVYGTGSNQPNEIQWWVKLNKAVNASSGKNYTEKFSTAAEKMLEVYAKVNAIPLCDNEEDDSKMSLPEGADEAIAEVEELCSKYLTAGVADSADTYLKVVSALEDVSARNMDKIKAEGVSVTVDGSSMSVANAIPYIASQMTTMYDDLDNLVKKLDIAINGNGLFGKIKSLDKLERLASDYHTTFSAWETTANEADTAMKRDDKASIEGTNPDPSKNVTRETKEIADKTVAEVGELKQRLVNIKGELEKLRDSIKDASYGNKKIKDIDSVDAFKGKTNNKVSKNEIPLLNGELSNYSSTTFSQLFEPGSQIAALDHLNDNDYNPDINPAPDNTVNTPSLLVYFDKQWNQLDENKFEKSEEDEEKMEGEKDAFLETEKENAGKYRGNGTPVARDFSAPDTGFSAGTGVISALASLIKDLSSGNLDKIRDDIYVTTYLTSMFSYATFDREGQYSLLSDADQKKLDTKNFSNYYDTQGVVGEAGKSGTWLSEDLEDHYNKSLTNKMINHGNNAAYLAELEYILYGKETNEDNVKAAFGQIYAIRLILNTGSAFQNFWSSTGNNTGSAIHLISVTVSGFTGGVVPVAVIKAVLLPILASMETCKDNSRLAAGFPVELYKEDEEDWWFALNPSTEGKSYTNFFTSLTNLVSGNSDPKQNKDQGLFYSDYLMFFVYAGLSGGGELEKNMYLRTAEVIQTNIAKMSGRAVGENGYTLKKAKTYFKLDATLRVEPFMLTLPYFQMEEYQNNLDTKTDWCTYQIQTVRGY